MKATFIALLLTIGLASFPTIASADLTSDKFTCIGLTAYVDDPAFSRVMGEVVRYDVSLNNERNGGMLIEPLWNARRVGTNVVDLSVRFLWQSAPDASNVPTFYFLCNPKAKTIEGYRADDSRTYLRRIYARVTNAKAAPVAQRAISKTPPREVSPSCPTVEATTTNAVAPDTPPDAQQQGITGVVNVVIQLDANSHIVGTPTIQSSPNKLLNEPAIVAAEQSTFRTEIRNCKPVAATYILAVEFNN